MVDQEGVERVERVEDEEWRKEGWMSPSSIDEREGVERVEGVEDEEWR